MRRSSIALQWGNLGPGKVEQHSPLESNSSQFGGNGQQRRRSLSRMFTQARPYAITWRKDVCGRHFSGLANEVLGQGTVELVFDEI